MAPKWQPRAARRAAVDGVYSPAMNPQPPPERLMGRNSDFAWDSFDSCSYLTHNYGTLRDDDRQIVEGVRDFFAPLDPAMVRQGLDVGSGTNLYPALTMLPLCDKITLWEYASSNVRWLRREVRRYSQSWDGFWDLLSQDPLYKSVEDPRQEGEHIRPPRVPLGRRHDVLRRRIHLGRRSRVPGRHAEVRPVAQAGRPVRRGVHEEFHGL